MRATIARITTGVIGRLAPKVEARATCGYYSQYCYCDGCHLYYRDCYACSDGSTGCSGCLRRDAHCSC